MGITLVTGHRWIKKTGYSGLHPVGPEPEFQYLSKLNRYPPTDNDMDHTDHANRVLWYRSYPVYLFGWVENKWGGDHHGYFAGEPAVGAA